MKVGRPYGGVDSVRKHEAGRLGEDDGVGVEEDDEVLACDLLGTRGREDLVDEAVFVELCVEDLVMMDDAVRFEQRSRGVADVPPRSGSERVDRSIGPPPAEAADGTDQQPALLLQRTALDTGDEENGWHHDTHDFGTSARGMTLSPVPGVKLTTSIPRRAASLQNFSHPRQTLP